MPLAKTVFSCPNSLRFIICRFEKTRNLWLEVLALKLKVAYRWDQVLVPGQLRATCQLKSRGTRTKFPDTRRSREERLVTFHFLQGPSWIL